MTIQNHLTYTNMNEVKFIKGKNIWTKSEWCTTIWIETNETTFNILRLNRNSVFSISVLYLSFNNTLDCSISTEWSSIIWKEDHGAFKIDIIWWDYIPPAVLTNWTITIWLKE